MRRVFGLVLSVGIAALGAGAAVALGRRGALAGIKNRDWIDDRPALRNIRGEIDDAERRAYAAGAQGDLEFIGVGMTGVVFCDEAGQAFKVARIHPPQERAEGQEPNTVAEEAAWLRAAAQTTIAPHVARRVSYNKTHHVLVRECVREHPTRDRRINERKLQTLHERISSVMAREGWGRPEYKPDSYVYTRDRGPVLVDAGFAVRRGRPLVRYVLDHLNGRRKFGRFEKPTDLAWALRMERGETIPPKVANALLQRLRAIDPNVEL